MKYLKSEINPWSLVDLLKWESVLGIPIGVFVIFALQGDINNININQDQIANLTNQFETLYNSLDNLINRFNQTLSDNGIDIVIIENGNLGIDFETDLSDEMIQRLSNMLDIIRTSIIQRESQIDNILDQIRELDENQYNVLYNRFITLKQTFSYH